MKKAALLATAGAIVLSAHHLLAQQTTGPVLPGSPQSSSSKSSIIERVLIRVNGEILTQTQLTQRQIEAWRDKNKDAKALPDDKTLSAQIAVLTPDVLVSSVNELLLVQRGRELGIKFSDDTFKSTLERIKKDQKLDDAGFKTALAQEGITLDQLRQNFERAYIINVVQQREIYEHLNLTEEERRQFYSAHKDAFMAPPTITLREIFVSVPTRTVAGRDLFDPTDDAAAKAKIDSVRDRATKGEDFAALVSQFSDSATKGSGGVIGPLNPDDINPTLKAELDKLQPGGLTETFRAAKGYQIFKLDARVEPALEPYEKVRDRIQQQIYETRLDGETQKLLERLRGQALIEWKDQADKVLYEKRLAEINKPK